MKRGGLADTRAVRSYYASLAEGEWERLERSSDGAVEFAITMDALDRHLAPRSSVLDIGGGPGRYAVALAQRGHAVTLVDLSPELLAIARRKIADLALDRQVPEVVEADARDLSRWPNEAFDAALCLGPFYHLPARDDRVAAASELARVLRPGGLLVAAFMPRLAFIRRTIARPDEHHHLLDPAWLAEVLDDGRFENDVAGRFTQGYGVRDTTEIEALLGDAGFATTEILSAESLSVGVEDHVGRALAAGGPIAAALAGLLTDLAGHPGAIGSARHLLYVGRRRAG